MPALFTMPERPFTEATACFTDASLATSIATTHAVGAAEPARCAFPRAG